MQIKGYNWNQLESPKNQPFFVMAGPCSIESPEQFLKVAEFVKAHGASFLRGGIHKMRTKPDTFQGVGDSALGWIYEVKKQVGLPLISEITDPRQVGSLSEVVDVFQVGSRNMYNYELLKELGTHPQPVMLKRGFSALIDEWVNAAKYVTQNEGAQVILCERGVRSFETKTRNMLDLAAVSYVKQNTELPVIVDPSHATGVPSLIAPMACAAIAAGADGIIVEVHPEPAKALSDGFQALDFAAFETLMAQIKPFLKAAGRELALVTP